MAGHPVLTPPVFTVLLPVLRALVVANAASSRYYSCRSVTSTSSWLSLKGRVLTHSSCHRGGGAWWGTSGDDSAIVQRKMFKSALSVWEPPAIAVQFCDDLMYQCYDVHQLHIIISSAFVTFTSVPPQCVVLHMRAVLCARKHVPTGLALHNKPTKDVSMQDSAIYVYRLLW